MGAVPAVVGGAALLGGIAGGMGKKQSAETLGSNTSRLIAAPETQEETRARALSFDALTSLDERLKALESSPILANLDQLLAELGQGPSQSRIDAANSFATQVFAPQRESLSQAFQDQRIEFARTAAQMGRSSSDPILAAKLAQEQIRQSRMLDAEQSSFAAQEAINAPMRQFQGQLTGLTGLSQQAIQNRQAVFSLGSSFANNLQQFRLATGTQIGDSRSNTVSRSGGGFGGFLSGALGGAAGGVAVGQAAGLFA